MEDEPVRSPAPDGEPPLPQWLGATLKGLTLGSGCLFLPLLLTFALVYSAGLFDRSLRPWAVVCWAALWAAFAGVGLGVGAAAGLDLLQRPARPGLGALHPVDRQWPQMARLTVLWAGAWFAGIAAVQLAQLGPLITRYRLPGPGGWILVAVAVVALGPRIALTLAELVIRGRPQAHEKSGSGI